MRWSILGRVLGLGLVPCVLLSSCSTRKESASSVPPTAVKSTVMVHAPGDEHLQLAYESGPVHVQIDDQGVAMPPGIGDPNNPKRTIVDPLHLERYPMLVVKPNPLVDHRMQYVHPDPNVEYFILEFDELE